MKVAVLVVILSVLGTDPVPTTSSGSRSYRFAYENVMGTSLDLKVNATSEEVAGKAEHLALEEIDRLDEILSTYRPGTEMRKWLATKDIPVSVSEDMYAVLALFDQWRERTSGALNPAAAVAGGLWKRAESTGVLPATEELSSAVAEMQDRHWSLDSTTTSARHLTSSPLVFNSFVKSYVINKVRDKLLTVPGVTGVMLNIGGDLVVAGDLTEAIRVDDDVTFDNVATGTLLSIRDRAVATSGNYRRGFRIGESWYSHIIDPFTASPASHVVSATVISPDPVVAGALATAFNVLPVDESEVLAGNFSGTEFRIVLQSGDVVESTGWRTFCTGEEAFTLQANGPELVVSFELASHDGRFRRPFVAVWIENESKSVRTLAVWYNKPRWLPDLRRWYSKNRDAMIQGDVTATGATRSPGKYTLQWDGKDSSGKLLPAGKYTLYIEVVREHGTYQLLKQEINWKGRTEKYTIDAGNRSEVSSAAAEIRITK